MKRDMLLFVIIIKIITFLVKAVLKRLILIEWKTVWSESEYKDNNGDSDKDIYIYIHIYIYIYIYIERERERGHGCQRVTRKVMSATFLVDLNDL